MKTHEITTSKGEFLTLLLEEGVVNLRIAELGNVVFDNPGKDEYGYDLSEVPLGCRPICKLSEATEEDAKLVVDKYLFNTNSEDGDCEVYEDYTTGDICFTSALDSLYSLLKSKGIDINSSNWYLFKKI